MSLQRRQRLVALEQRSLRRRSRNWYQTADCSEYNDWTGEEEVKGSFKYHLLPFLHEDLKRLASMVRPIPSFTAHVLDISQQPGGLTLCTSLLQTHFKGEWIRINAVAYARAAALSMRQRWPRGSMYLWR